MQGIIGLTTQKGFMIFYHLSGIIFLKKSERERHKMSYYDFGEILRSLRKQSGLTQSELGRRVGLSKAVVSKYENGMGYPTFDTLIRIARIFSVTTDYLLGVESGNILDVSGLSDSQLEAVQRTVNEFKKVNEKKH